MRHVCLSIQLIAFLMLLSGCGQKESQQLEGTWRMESGSYTDLQTDQRIETDALTRFSIKIMGPSHFAVVEMFKDNPDSLFFAAVGTYELTGDKYIERYDASNVGYQVGTLRKFDYTLEGDRWTISRCEEDMELHEVWVRVQQL